MFLLAMSDYADKAAAGWHYKVLASPPFIIYGQLFGGDAYILIAFYALGIWVLLAGLGAALKNRRFERRRLDLWIIKIITYSLCVFVVAIVNGAIIRSWGVNLPLLDTVLTILIASESLSFFENLHELGCPVPPVLLRLAAGVKKKAGQKLDALLDDEEAGEGREGQGRG
jgi:phage-related holin